MDALDHNYSKGTPFKMHAHYRRDAGCDYAVEVQRAARLMRGIQSCVAVLATERPETLELSGYIRPGLIEAIDELASEVTCELDDLSDRIKAGELLPER